MNKDEEITKAIGAHGVWKQRLKAAIDSGKSDTTVESVRVDNGCDFGKWLHALSGSDKNSEHWKTVQSLHAQFHSEAAQVLDFAIKGEKEKAKSSMTLDSRFADISARLTAAMMAWKRAR